MRIFPLLEVVGRGSDTQLQVGEKIFFLNLALQVLTQILQCSLQLSFDGTKSALYLAFPSNRLYLSQFDIPHKTRLSFDGFQFSSNNFT